MTKRGKLLCEFIYYLTNISPEHVKSAIRPCSGLNVLKFKTPNRDLKEIDGKTKNGTVYEIYEPKVGPHPDNCIIYFHGGAYIGKQSWVYRYQSRYFCKAADGARVVMLDYDVAPKAQYPTQLNQALDLWEEVTEVMGYDPANIMVGGDSAGAHLTLTLLLKLRDMGKKLPRAAFGMSPWGDMTASGPSYYENYDKDAMFGRKHGTMNAEKQAMLMDFDVYAFCLGKDRTDPYISPLFGDYHNFPPMHFTIGGHEMLRSDGEGIAKKINDAGGKATVFIGEGMFHDFCLFHGICPESTAGFKSVIDFINEQFNYYGYTYPTKEYIIS